MGVASLIPAVCIAAAAPAAADVDGAIEAAKVRAAAGDYDGALATVRAARQRNDDPDLIFVEAQLLRISGDCGAALERYDEFLARDPPAEDRVEVERYITACEEQVGPRPALVTPPPDPASMPAPTDSPTEPRPSGLEPSPPPNPPPATRDRVGLALWISGGVLLAGGTGVYASSWVLRGRAERGDPTLDDYLARERRASVLNGVGLATMSVGVAILLAATVRHVIRRRQRRESGVLSSFRWSYSPRG